MHTVTVNTALLYMVQDDIWVIFLRHSKLQKLSSSLTANLRKCAVTIFFIVHCETDSLRFMRLHNCWIIKQFWEIQKELSDINKMEPHWRCFSHLS